VSSNVVLGPMLQAAPCGGLMSYSTNLIEVPWQRWFCPKNNALANN
jgi:hypothetical protein